MTTPCTFIPITRARPGLEGQVSDSLQRSQVKKLLMKSSTGGGRQTAASSLCIKPPTRLWADSFNKFGYFASTLIKKCNIEVKLWPNNKEHLLAEYSISEYLFNMFHSRVNNALENLWRVALSSYLSFQGIFSSPLKGFLHPLKNPHRQVFVPFPPSCAPFQSNSLSKSTALSTIKISKVKIWRELFKRALFCALTRDTFVSKYFWTPEK